MCSCTIFGSPRINFMFSYKRIMSSPGKFICVLIISKPAGKFDVILEVSLKRSLRGKNNRYFSSLAAFCGEKVLSIKNSTSYQ